MSVPDVILSSWQKIIKFSGDLMKFWQKQGGKFIFNPPRK